MTTVTHALAASAMLEAMVGEIGRTAVQRTTEYGRPSTERLETARRFADIGFAATGRSLKVLPKAL